MTGLYNDPLMYCMSPGRFDLTVRHRCRACDVIEQDCVELMTMLLLQIHLLLHFPKSHHPLHSLTPDLPRTYEPGSPQQPRPQSDDRPTEHTRRQVIVPLDQRRCYRRTR